MLTRDTLCAAMDRFDAVVQEWSQLEEGTPDPRAENLFRRWGSSVVRAIQPFVAEAAQELCGLLDTDQIERSAWPIVRELDAFDAAFRACAERLSVLGSGQDPSGGNAVWRPWDRAKQERDHPRRFSRPEPIPQLLGRVDHRQIAKMYGWYLENGEPDIERLQREIDNPGSEYRPDQWVSRHEVAYWADLETWWGQRTKRLQAARPRAARPRRPASETLEELVLAGVNRRQVHKMIPGVTDDEIDALCVEHGIVLDAPLPGSVHEVLAHRDSDLRRRQLEQARRLPEKLSSKLSTIETYAELGQDRVARVIRMAEDGHKPKTIADALRSQLVHPMSPGEAGKIIAAHRRQQAQTVPEEASL